MKLRCPETKCNSHQIPGLERNKIVRKGSFFRKSDSKWIQRFRCLTCGRSFSRSSLSPSKNQKARRITPHLYELVCSGVSQRRAARILKVNRKTVVRRFRYLAEQSRLRHVGYLAARVKAPVSSVEFDDLETSEHTKCKPISVALAIEPKSRKILGFQVSQMPAKGRLAQISVRKYGYREDQREVGWNALLESLTLVVKANATFKSDENPHYPKHILRHFPDCTHKKVPGGRGAITGQGELKKKRYDPIFSLNHTCAMLRANLNRLFRRTWCTTKTKQGLIDHLSIYVQYHNRKLTPLCPLKGAS